MPTDGLVAHYTFDGSTNDRTSNAFHGTASGNVTFVNGRTSAAGKAVHFDGVSGHIAVPNVSGSRLEPTDGLTISMWIFADATRGAADWCHMFAKSDAFNNGYVVKWVHDGNTDLGAFLISDAVPSEFKTPNDYVKTSNASLTKAWHHIAFTWSKITNRLTLYVDGTVRAYKEDCIYDGSHSGSTLYIGGQPYIDALGRLVQSTFPGAMDDVRFYSKGLTALDIIKLASEHL